MILAIIGSRDFLFDPYVSTATRIRKHLDDLTTGLEIELVLSGGDQGPDTWGIEWAKSNGIHYYEFIPDWDRFGKKAGPIRNSRIAEVSDIVVAFWDGTSRGTLDCITKAKRMGRKVIIVLPDDTIVVDS